MSLKRRKKNTRLRGSKTHGWGAMKKHRGAGHRGGRGNAGSGKRGDAKKPSYWKDMSRYGKHGFHHRRPLVRAINVGQLASGIDSLVAHGRASGGKTFAVDLAAIGYGRLLGGGVVTRPIEITVAVASARAIEKVAAAGGKVVVTTQAETEK
jgi:large subunit ribosomal protein L15